MSIVFCDRATAFGDIAWLPGADTDPQIPDGVHWHVTMGRSGGLPAGRGTVIVDLETDWDSFRNGNPTWPPGQVDPATRQIDADQGHELTLIYRQTRGRDQRCWAGPDPGRRRLTVAAADPGSPGKACGRRMRSGEADPGLRQLAVASADCQVVRITGQIREGHRTNAHGLAPTVPPDHNRVSQPGIMAKKRHKTSVLPPRPRRQR